MIKGYKSDGKDPPPQNWWARVGKMITCKKVTETRTMIWNFATALALIRGYIRKSFEIFPLFKDVKNWWSHIFIEKSRYDFKTLISLTILTNQILQGFVVFVFYFFRSKRCIMCFPLHLKNRDAKWRYNFLFIISWSKKRVNAENENKIFKTIIKIFCVFKPIILFQNISVEHW